MEGGNTREINREEKEKKERERKREGRCERRKKKVIEIHKQRE